MRHKTQCAYVYDITYSIMLSKFEANGGNKYGIITIHILLWLTTINY